MNCLNDLPTPYHFVQYATRVLTEHGFVELEGNELETLPRKFFIRSAQSLMAFNRTDEQQGVVCWAKPPSVALKVGRTYVNGTYEQCKVNAEGPGVWWSWVARDFTVAGAVNLKDGVKLVNLKEPVCMIPPLAIHLLHGSGASGEFRLSEHMNPIFGIGKNEDADGVHILLARLAKELECDPNDIIDYDLTLFPTDRAAVVGLDKKWLTGYNIDGTIGSVEGLHAFCEAEDPERGYICYVYSHSNEVTDQFLLPKNVHFGSNFFLVDLRNFLPKAITPAISPAVLINCSDVGSETQQAFVKSIREMDPSLTQLTIDSAQTNVQMGITVDGLHSIKERISVMALSNFQNHLKNVFRFT